LFCLVARHALLFTVALIAHLRALLFVIMLNYLQFAPCCLPSFFSSTSCHPPHCCFATLLLAFIPCYYAFLCQLGFLPHFLVQVEEFGTKPTSFIQQAKVKKVPKFLSFFFLAFVFLFIFLFVILF
jgi:hypothetical protein